MSYDENPLPKRKPGLLADDLLTYVAEIIAKHGNCPVHVLTENDTYKERPAWQVEQRAGGVCYSAYNKVIIIVPENF